MKHIAHREYRDLLASLRKLIRASDHSLRSLAAASQQYEAPEAMHHSNLSEVLRLVPGRNLYLWQALALCKLLGVHPAEWFCGHEAGLLAQAMGKMSPQDRAALLRAAADKLTDRPGTIELRKRLRSAAAADRLRPTD